MESTSRAIEWGVSLAKQKNEGDHSSQLRVFGGYVFLDPLKQVSNVALKTLFRTLSLGLSCPRADNHRFEQFCEEQLQVLTDHHRQVLEAVERVREGILAGKEILREEALVNWWLHLGPIFDESHDYLAWIEKKVLHKEQSKIEDKTFLEGLDFAALSHLNQKRKVPKQAFFNFCNGIEERKLELSTWFKELRECSPRQVLLAWHALWVLKQQQFEEKAEEKDYLSLLQRLFQTFAQELDFLREPDPDHLRWKRDLQYLKQLKVDDQQWRLVSRQEELEGSFYEVYEVEAAPSEEELLEAGQREVGLFEGEQQEEMPLERRHLVTFKKSPVDLILREPLESHAVFGFAKRLYRHREGYFFMTPVFKSVASLEYFVKLKGMLGELKQQDSLSTEALVVDGQEPLYYFYPPVQELGASDLERFCWQLAAKDPQCFSDLIGGCKQSFFAPFQGYGQIVDRCIEEKEVSSLIEQQPPSQRQELRRFHEKVAEAAYYLKKEGKDLKWLRKWHQAYGLRQFFPGLKELREMDLEDADTAGHTSR